MVQKIQNSITADPDKQIPSRESIGAAIAGSRYRHVAVYAFNGDWILVDEEMHRVWDSRRRGYYRLERWEETNSLSGWDRLYP